MLLKDLTDKFAFIAEGYSAEKKFFDYETLSFTEHADISTNIAFLIGKSAKKNPMILSEEIKHLLDNEAIENIEIVKPGFINIILKDKFLIREIEEIAKNSKYGQKTSSGVSANIEFISANPTGPLVLVNARAGIFGNTLYNVMNYAGFDAVRENYVNDAGNQVYNLGASILYHISKNKPHDFPENGYKGEYVKIIAEDFKKYSDEDDWNDKNIQICAEYGKKRILEMQKNSLERFKIVFDSWIFESSIRKELVNEVLDILDAKGYIYELDGAKYLKTSLFGDDKDRVIFKSNKEMTYFLPDIAYHYSKIKRNFKKIIDVLGPDHHGYVARIKSAVNMLSDEASVDVIIAQLVTLYKNNQKIEMSKRAGEFITMDELAEEIDPDVIKFLVLSRKLSQPFNFDIEKAKEETMENPVFYVQYAHARLTSLFIKAGLTSPEMLEFNYEKIECEKQRKLITKLMEFPYMAYSISNNYEIQKLPNYLVELSSQIHSFYHDFRIISENQDDMKRKIGILFACRNIIASGLEMMGITPKERMDKDEIQGLGS